MIHSSTVLSVNPLSSNSHICIDILVTFIIACWGSEGHTAISIWSTAISLQCHVSLNSGFLRKVNLNVPDISIHCGVRNYPDIVEISRALLANCCTPRLPWYFQTHRVGHGTSSDCMQLTTQLTRSQYNIQEGTLWYTLWYPRVRYCAQRYLWV